MKHETIIADGPDPIDVHVGSRIRLRRKMLNLSQEKLGDALGRTFHQVQKYERGRIRVSASVLYRTAQFLQVPPSYFFDGYDQMIGADPFNVSDDTAVSQFLITTEGVELARHMIGIQTPALRKAVLALARCLHNQEIEA